MRSHTDLVTDGRTPRNRVRVVVLREARYAGQAQPAGLIAALRATGVSVVVAEPDSCDAAGRSGLELRGLL